MELFSYLLKVSACSALFFAFYLLILRRLTFFKINRFYLLFSLLFSFIIPALQFSIKSESVPSNTVLTTRSLQTEVFYLNHVTVNSIQTSATGDFNWLSVLPFLYGSIVFGLFCLTGWRIIQLFKEVKSKSIKINGLTIVPKTKGFTNCSFFNYVFINENSLTEAELSVLLAHEEVHVRQYHSIDKLFMMGVKAVLWFNPIVYLYDKALEEVHEYEADEGASKNVGTERYANLLLMLAVNKSSNPLIHNFVKSPVKKRIKMLFNAKTKRMKKLAYLFIVPLGLCLVWSFTIKIVHAAPISSTSSVFSTKSIAATVIPIITQANDRNQTVTVKENRQLEAVDDTLRLVGSNSLGKNPKVVIDGKLYKSDILTKLSPNSVRSTYTTGDSITIITRNNEIEYATPIEIENVKIKNAIDKRSLYTRYTQWDQDGEASERITTHQPHGTTTYKIAKGTRVAIFIYGKMYTEDEAKMLKPDLLANHNGMSFFRKGEIGFEKLVSQYMMLNEYDAVLNILGNPVN